MVKNVKKVSLFWAVIVALIAVLVTNMITVNIMTVSSKYKVNQGIIQNGVTDDGLEDLAAIQSYFEKYYYYYDKDAFDSETYSQNVIESFILATGDQYAYYWDEQEYEDYVESMNGNFVGIGILATYSEDPLGIETLLVFPDSPAEKAGLKAGDVIVAIDGNYIRALDSDPINAYNIGVGLVAGEDGSRVTMILSRGKEEIETQATRGVSKALSVTYGMASDKKTGIIRIMQFDMTTPEQFKAAVESLEKDGAKQFVFDVRGNPGGQLSSVCDVLSYIIPEKELLAVLKDSLGNENKYYSSSEHVMEYPMAVITDENTASAAELFTACLKDYGLAYHVGDKTFGKGCAQTIFELPSGGAVKLTTSMYTSAYTENYDGKGILPDLSVSLSDELKKVNLLKLTEENDTQLKAALESFDKAQGR